MYNDYEEKFYNIPDNIISANHTDSLNKVKINFSQIVIITNKIKYK